MADKKKHHYVPYSYLKRFSYDKINTWVQFSTDKIKTIPLSQQNQKDYLYSLGRKYFGDNHNLFEDFLGEKVESPFNLDMSKTIDFNEVPANEKLVSIVYFAIIQSCRPLIYKDEFEENFKQLGINKGDNILMTYGFLVMSMINKFWEKIKTCSVEILVAPESRCFVTSDNPATLWIPSSDEKIFVPLTVRFLYDWHPDLELIMPLSPKFLLKVYLNRPRPYSLIIWHSNHKQIIESELSEINSRIRLSKHRCVYSSERVELELLK